MADNVILADTDGTIREPKLKDLPLRLTNIPKWILLLFIRAYQSVISPGLPPDTCRYYPTCSHYGYQAIYKHGALKGSFLAIKRIIRCNPFSKGGIDPVP